jgi:predicted enzyme related to lactoylglutathione lyase
MAVQFEHIMLLVKDILASVKFYSQGLGFTVKMSSPEWAELDANGTILVLHAAHENAQGGNSLILSFHVDDVNAAIVTLEKLGAKLETQVLEKPSGRVAAMRTPDGHRLSLLQPAAVGAA